MAADSTARSLASSPQLVPLGIHQGKPGFAINRPAVVVGSRQDARIHLQSSTVSNHHALLIVTREGMYVRDLASRTHTFVNGRPVREAQLEGGDQLQIGRFTFRYVAPDKPLPPAIRAPQAVLDVDGEGIPVPFDGRVIVIGRRLTCDIALGEASASTTHAVIFEKDGLRYVRDLTSRTGTFVNGKRIHQEKLNDNDVIRCGETNIAYLLRGSALLDEPPQIDALPDLEIAPFDDEAREVGAKALAAKPQAAKPPAAKTQAPKPPVATIPFDDSGLDLLSPEESSRIEQSPVEPLGPKAPYDPLADTAYPGKTAPSPTPVARDLLAPAPASGPLELEPLELEPAQPEPARPERLELAPAAFPSPPVRPAPTPAEPEPSLDAEEEADFGLIPLEPVAEQAPLVIKPAGPDDTALDTAPELDLELAEPETASAQPLPTPDAEMPAPPTLPVAAALPAAEEIVVEPLEDEDPVAALRRGWRGPALPVAPAAEARSEVPPVEISPVEVARAAEPMPLESAALDSPAPQTPARKKGRGKSANKKTGRGKASADDVTPAVALPVAEAVESVPPVSAPVDVAVAPEVAPTDAPPVETQGVKTQAVETPAVEDRDEVLDVEVVRAEPLPPRRMETHAGEDALVSDEPTPVEASVTAAAPAKETPLGFDLDDVEVIDPASRSGTPLTIDAEVLETGTPAAPLVAAAPSTDAPAPLEIDLSTARFNDAEGDTPEAVDAAALHFPSAETPAVETSDVETSDVRASRVGASGGPALFQPETIDLEELEPQPSLDIPLAPVAGRPGLIDLEFDPDAPDTGATEPIAPAAALPEQVPPLESHAPLIGHEDAEATPPPLLPDRLPDVLPDLRAEVDLIDLTEPTPESALAADPEVAFDFAAPPAESVADPLSDTQFARSVNDFNDADAGDLVEADQAEPPAEPPAESQPVMDAHALDVPPVWPPVRAPLQDTIMGGSFGMTPAVGSILGLGGLDVDVPAPQPRPVPTPLRGLAGRDEAPEPVEPPVPAARAEGLSPFDPDDDASPAGPNVEVPPAASTPAAPVPRGPTLPPRPRRNKPARVGFNGEPQRPSVSPFAGASAGQSRTIADVLIGGTPNGRSVDVFSTPSPVGEIPPVTEIPPVARPAPAVSRALSPDDVDIDFSDADAPAEAAEPAAKIAVPTAPPDDVTTDSHDSSDATPGPRFRPRGQIRPLVPAGSETGTPVQTAHNKSLPFGAPVAVQPNVELAKSRKKHLRWVFWLLMAMFVLGPAVALAIYHYYPPQAVSVQAQLRFIGLDKVSVLQQQTRRMEQDELVDAVETRNLAINRLRPGTPPGFLDDAIARVKMVEIDPAKRWPEDQKDLMRLRIKSTDLAADRERLLALAQALQSRNEALATAAAAVRDTAAQASARITQTANQIDELNRELAAVKARAEAAIGDESLPQLEQAAIAADSAQRTARADVHELEAQFKRLSVPPSTQPVVDPKVALAADEAYQTLLKKITALSAKADAIQSAAGEQSAEARKGVDDALEQFKGELENAEKTVPGGAPEMIAYVAVAKKMAETTKQLTEDLVRRSDQQRKRITEWKTKLDALLEKRRNELFAKDPTLIELSQRRAMAERQRNAADASGLGESEEAQRNVLNIKLLETLITAQQERIGSDPEFANTVKEFQDIIKLNEDSAAEDRRSIDESLAKTQKEFLDAAPEANKLPAVQQAAADGLKKKLAAINDARTAYNKQVDEAAARQNAEAAAVKQQLADVQGQLTLREREVVALAEQQAQEATGTARERQLAEVGAKLAAARIADASATEALEVATAARRNAQDARAQLASNDKRRVDLANQIAALEKLNVINRDTFATNQEKLATLVEPDKSDPLITDDSASLGTEPRLAFSLVGGGTTLAVLMIPMVWCLFKAGHEHPLPIESVDEAPAEQVDDRGPGFPVMPAQSVDTHADEPEHATVG